MDSDKNWTRWVLQTALTWEDMNFVIHETGIAHIDHEHKRMTNFMVELNKILSELEKSFSTELFETQKKIMKGFYEYTAVHCKEEEEFLKNYNMPGLELQEREHKKLLRVMKDIIFQFETGRVTSAFRDRVKLLSIVVNHINTIDNQVFKLSNISKQILEIATWADISTFIRIVHIPIIDKQHKALTEMIVSFFKISDNSIRDSLVEIIEFVKVHIKTETEIIEKYNIPGIEIQDKQHDDFIVFLTSNLSDLENGNNYIHEKMKEELLLMWIEHINIYDYNTFRNHNWMKDILLKATVPEDVTWLIAKMGIKSVDDDHSHFIDLLFENLKLFEDSNSLAKEDRVNGLNTLYIYAKDHFYREEEVMRERKLLDMEQHIVEHKSILKSLAYFGQLNSSDKVDLSNGFKRKILALWITHINDTDAGTFGTVYE